MTRMCPPATAEATLSAAILIDAAWCWRDARDNGRSIQPDLFTMLSRHGCGMLAPVLDSVMALTEAALGRRLVVGEGLLSADARLLIGLLAGSQSLPQDNTMTAVLDHAVRSARIMMALVAPASMTSLREAA